MCLQDTCFSELYDIAISVLLCSVGTDVSSEDVIKYLGT